MSVLLPRVGVRPVLDRGLRRESAQARPTVTELPRPASTSTEQPATAQRALLVGSSGGHLAQLLALEPWWSAGERSWVTFRTSDAVSQLDGEVVDFAYSPTTRNVPNLIRNFWVAWRVLRKRRPDVVVTTGAAVAIPFFVIARLLGIQTIYVEVYDRLTSRTVSGRVCRPLASAFLVQWPEQQKLYPGSRVIGCLL
jgi:UDP-N-acetylglucosamine:LPS N-acetylglucosamine transferase